MNRKWHVEKNLEEILNYMDELDEEDLKQTQIGNTDSLQIVLFPPDDGNDSDVDRAGSDNENEFSLHHLGKKMMAQPGEINGKIYGEIIELTNAVIATIYDEDPLILENEIFETAAIEHDIIPLFHETMEIATAPLKKKKIQRFWQETLLTKEVIPKISMTSRSLYAENVIENDKSPVDLFKDIFDSTVMERICYETNSYAIFKGDMLFSTSIDELYKFFGILIVSGYITLPSYRMYWQQEEDSYNILVSGAMSRNKFEKIKQYLHFNDNRKIDINDRLYKVRPLIEHANNKFAEFAQPVGKYYSLDEAMEPYYGRCRMKQFIRGKPIRFGYKFWCLNTTHGYLLRFIPYTGKSDRDKSVPLGSNVAINLCKDLVPKNSIIFMDNYFTSFGLVDIFNEHDFKVVGTIRKDRVEKAPLKELKKTPRGTIHSIRNTGDSTHLIRWNDNNQVTMITNINEPDIVLNETICSRWSAKESKRVTIPQPYIIKLYNKGMGGVDLCDQHRATYRMKTRTRKWYWPIFRFIFEASLVNQWLIYREKDPKISQLLFRRSIAQSLLQNDSDTKQNLMKGRSRKKVVKSSLRYDGINHWIHLGDTQRRCAFCPKTTKYICTKCNLALHATLCFKKFHTETNN